MKEVFFTFLAISLPILAVGGLAYMFLHGLYRVIDDWRLSRELRQLRHETAGRPDAPSESPVSELDLLAAFGDRPTAPEPKGIATFPLDPGWDLARASARAAEALNDSIRSVDPPPQQSEASTPPITEPESSEHIDAAATDDQPNGAAVEAAPSPPTPPIAEPKSSEHIDAAATDDQSSDAAIEAAPSPPPPPPPPQDTSLAHSSGEVAPEVAPEPPPADTHVLPAPTWDSARLPEQESRIDPDVEEVPQRDGGENESNDRNADDWPHRTLD